MPHIRFVTHASAETGRYPSFPSSEDRLGSVGLGQCKRADLPRPLRLLRSPARICEQTAAALGWGDADVERDLRDQDPGLWAGRSIDTLSHEELTAWRSGVALPGGEGVAALIDRVRTLLDRFRSEPAGERLVALTHQSVARAAFVVATSGTATDFWQVELEPLSAFELRSDRIGWVIHLAGAGGTDRGRW